MHHRLKFYFSRFYYVHFLSLHATASNCRQIARFIRSVMNKKNCYLHRDTSMLLLGDRTHTSEISVSKRQESTKKGGGEKKSYINPLQSYDKPSNTHIHIRAKAYTFWFYILLRMKESTKSTCFSIWKKKYIQSATSVDRMQAAITEREMGKSSKFTVQVNEWSKTKSRAKTYRENQHINVLWCDAIHWVLYAYTFTTSTRMPMKGEKSYNG